MRYFLTMHKILLYPENYSHKSGVINQGHKWVILFM